EVRGAVSGPRRGERAGGRLQDVRPSGGMLSIGALARATAIPVETLRTWERRYGYPVPARKPSGHRLYPVRSVSRLRRIARAIAGGHRASGVAPASDAHLRALLQAASPRPARRPPR